MTNKYLIILGLLALILLSGCANISVDAPKEYRGEDLQVYSLCADRVICYEHFAGYHGSGSCFRDKDLVDKYCRGQP